MPRSTTIIFGGAIMIAAALSGSGVAAAQPDIEAIVNTTCTYPQFTAALDTQSPELASQLESSPLVAGWLRELVSSPPAQRRVMIEQYQGYPGFDQYVSVAAGAAGSCQSS